LAAALTSEQGQLQAIAQREPGWMAGKKAHAKWEEQVARQKTRIAQIALRLDKVGEIEEAAGVYTQMKIEELAERKLRFDKPELAQEWDKIQRRERQALIPTIENTQSLDQDLGRSLRLSTLPFGRNCALREGKPYNLLSGLWCSPKKTRPPHSLRGKSVQLWGEGKLNGPLMTRLWGEGLHATVLQRREEQHLGARVAKAVQP
jgi:hypothetical protein